ncbi:MFS general substrate transporter [Roridomyces roridus]|uniref:MFS general substrate transporter n=1 Tax=Roridomyces roridus TaxID=1738132 RepID=A0AAD7FXI3_9AGAR|nr:MFS general substrate transporter [Roridomyces roridus]
MPMSSEKEKSVPLPEIGTPERMLAERKLVCRLDRQLLPTLVLINMMNNIDRSGITAARLRGLEQDLRLSDLQYNVILSALYILFCPAQLPSNIASSSPPLILNRTTRYGMRVFSLVGLTLIFEIELALRSGILYAGYILANAFGAYGGNTGNSSLEMGSITITFGMLAIWVLPDYPNNTSWIVGNERRLAQVRLAEDAGEADQDNAEDTPLRGLKLAALDPLVWALTFMNITQYLGLSFVIFFPTLTRSLGFSTTISLVLAAPPWLVASVICCLNAWHADATRERYFHMAGTWWVVILGFIISIATKNLAARYLSMFFMVFGFAGGIFADGCVGVESHPRPPSKRAAAIAIVNGMGNLGTIMGSYSWKSEWSLCGVVLRIRQHLVWRNKRLEEDEQVAVQGADEERVREAALLEGITFEQAMEKRKGFRYLY